MTASVGIREFRAGLADYAAGSEPVAVTRHGVTVGWFIPPPVDHAAQGESLRLAGQRLDALLEAEGMDVDGVVDDVKATRAARWWARLAASCWRALRVWYVRWTSRPRPR